MGVRILVESGAEKRPQLFGQPDKVEFGTVCVGYPAKIREFELNALAFDDVQQSGPGLVG